jgi:hypothetical protein
MAEYDAARDLTQPVPPHERWSRAQLRYDYLQKNKAEKGQKNRTKQSQYGTGTVGGLIGAMGSRGAGEGDVEWYCQANVLLGALSRRAGNDRTDTYQYDIGNRQ